MKGASSRCPQVTSSIQALPLPAASLLRLVHSSVLVSPYSSAVVYFTLPATYFATPSSTLRRSLSPTRVSRPRFRLGPVHVLLHTIVYALFQNSLLHVHHLFTAITYRHLSVVNVYQTDGGLVSTGASGAWTAAVYMTGSRIDFTYLALYILVATFQHPAACDWPVRAESVFFFLACREQLS